MSGHKLAEALREAQSWINQFAKIRSAELDAKVAEALAAHEAEQQAGEAVAPYGYVYELWVEGALCGVSAVMGEQIGLDVPFGEAGVHHGGKVREVSLFTHPQQPLSEVEAASIFKAWREGPLWLHMTRGVEAAHKIGITKDTK